MKTKHCWIVFFLISLLAGGTLSVALGQDMFWDNQNYHFYNAFALLHGREAVDFFAAGFHGYTHPLADIPYYLLAYEWLPSSPKIVAFLMGLPAGVIIFLTFACLWKITRNWVWTLLAALFGLGGYSFLAQVGAGTNEIPVALFMLAAIFAFLHFRARPEKAAMLAGACAGIAAGLKLTAIIYVIPLLLGLLFFFPGWRIKARVFFFFSAAWWVSFLLLYGWWGFHLWRETGNPFFPTFNNLFHSPLVPPEKLDFDFETMRPENWRMALFYPFYWMDGNRVTDGLTTSDVRFLLAEISAGLYGTVFLLRRARMLWSQGGIQLKKIQSVCNFSDEGRLLGFFFLFLLSSFALWEILFSSLRYVVAIECLLGGLCFLCIKSMFSIDTRKVAAPSNNIPAPTIFSSQTGFLLLTSALLFFLAIALVTSDGARSYRGNFGKSFVEADVPPLPRDTLVILAPGSSFLAPPLLRKAPDAAFIGGLDYMSVRPQMQNSLLRQRIAEKVSSHTGPIRFIVAERTLPFFQKLLPIDGVLPADTPAPQTFQTNFGNYVLLPLRKDLPAAQCATGIPPADPQH